jgi:phosphomannomutase
MLPLDPIFKAYDVRGSVPDQLDDEVSRAVGWAFVSFTAASRLVVARDMRESGVPLSEAFIEGATSAGATVMDLGLASTDLLYFASGRLDVPGAMFTASHNPARYNGIKMSRPGASPVGQDSGLREIKALAAGFPGDGARGQARGRVEHIDLLDEYAAHVRSFVDTDVLAPLRVVADTANGMGGLVVPRVMAPLPFEVEILYPELDGDFPNHPADPIQPENLVDLNQRVLATGANVGLAFDGDADRVFLVDEKAQPLSGSLTTALVAKAMLEKHPGATILYNLICSKAVPEVIEENGGVPVRTRVGHSFIKAVMAETGAVFGGEHSGHYYFRDNYRADSGLIAAVVVLELLSKASRPLSELRRPFERYADSGEINTEVGDPGRVVESIAAELASVPGPTLDRTDGLTVDWGDWWFNIRPSNTEPLLRLNLEARTPAERDEHVAAILSMIDLAARDTAGAGPTHGRES